jgi:hypothetical protein
VRSGKTTLKDTQGCNRRSLGSPGVEFVDRFRLREVDIAEGVREFHGNFKLARYLAQSLDL